MPPHRQPKTKEDNPNFITIKKMHNFYMSRVSELSGHCPELNPILSEYSPISGANTAGQLTIELLHDFLHKKLGFSTSRICNILAHILRVKNLSECSIPGILARPFIFTRGQNKVINFNQACRIIDELGIPTTTEERLISWIDNYLSNTKNTLSSLWVKWPKLCDEIKRELITNCDNFKAKPKNDTTLNTFVEQFAATYLKIKKLDKQSNEFYATTRELYGVETEVNDMMRDLFFDTNHQPRTTARFMSRDPETLTADIDKIINKYQIEREITFQPAQLEAIRGCCLHQLGVIIGQPGTGKSTIAECITECLYALRTTNISLTAISGMAVNQIKNKCEQVKTRNEKLCGTVDKLLLTVFPKLTTIDSPDTIFIDEFSMVDILKWHQLLKYIRKFRCQVILIGDSFQLPSIGAGKLLSTICQYPKKYPIFQLRDIMRQTGHLSQVIHRMSTEPITREDFNSLNFILEDFDGGEHSADFINGLIDRYALNRTNCRFLCAQNEGKCGIIQINRILQNIYNPLGSSITPPPNIKSFTEKQKAAGQQSEPESNKLVFRVGDTVIRTVNNYAYADDGLIYLNGEFGTLTKYLDKSTGKIDPYRFEIEYESTSGNSEGVLGKREVVTLDELYENFTVGYAISVHKSQGSQCANVVILMTTDQKFMWTGTNCDGFNLLYTAISRAKNRCIIAGKYGYFKEAQNGRIRKDIEPKRLSVCCHPQYMF